MTKFINKNFNYDGMYLTYGEDRRFVARFKYGGMVAFKKFLRENFTVEEYFKLLESSLGPLKVLETKGYVSPIVAKQLKARGYAVTQDGFKQMIQDNIAAMQAKKEAA